MKNRILWRCFHCGEAFTARQRALAAQHFGADESATPVCLMRGPGEHSLLSALRAAEEELARWRAETMPILNAMAAMQADHACALRREEEGGYARGVADARAEAAPLKRALEWYADAISYVVTQMREPRSAVHDDGGKRAREALAEFGT
jgi:hypothetical protein